MVSPALEKQLKIIFVPSRLDEIVDTRERGILTRKWCWSWWRQRWFDAANLHWMHPFHLSWLSEYFFLFNFNLLFSSSAHLWVEFIMSRRILKCKNANFACKLEKCFFFALWNFLQLVWLACLWGENGNCRVIIEQFKFNTRHYVSSSNASRLSCVRWLEISIRRHPFSAPWGANFSPNLTPFLVKVKRFSLPPHALFWQLNWFNQTHFSLFLHTGLDADSQRARRGLAQKKEARKHKRARSELTIK